MTDQPKIENQAAPAPRVDARLDALMDIQSHAEIPDEVLDPCPIPGFPAGLWSTMTVGFKRTHIFCYIVEKRLTTIRRDDK